MTYDVYLAGVSEKEWRETFKDQISQDVRIFDPLVENYKELDEHEKANQAAKELIHMEGECSIIAFYLNAKWEGVTALIELGEAIGRNKQIIVCLEGDVFKKCKISS